ncbi:unnamed protein product [Blepharisma stoltei]|uniref:Uncharacterized protein n=1 Tax=Blepharisma stoltei TaxID=1481888 RepID=A0AAU9J4G1_9CILI|nr:unnamed protein product [Blepharisma stoltei]
MDSSWLETKEKISNYLDEKIAPIKDELNIQQELLAKLLIVIQESCTGEFIDKRETAPNSVSPNKSPKLNFKKNK